jgi:multimeric flavodoxin WrbA
MPGIFFVLEVTFCRLWGVLQENKLFLVGGTMKKVVILNASPRKNGNISQMLDIIGDSLFENGTEVTIIDVCKLDFRPCMGCMKCRSAHDCVMPEDDAKRILRLVQESDGLVVGSPCYWGNMTGQLKMLFDRWVYGMMDHSEKGYPQPLQKGKKAIIVTTCTTPWPFNLIFKQSAGTVRALKEVLCWSGFKITNVIQKGGTHNGNGLTPKEIAKCQKIAKVFHLSP